MAVFELMNLSVNQLKVLAGQAGVDTTGKRSKADLVTHLVANLTEADVTRLAADYIYAGRTSVVWTRLGAGAVSTQFLDAALQQVAGRNPFGAPRQPNVVTDEPFLIEAVRWRPGKVVLRFIVRKREQLVLRNMQFVSEAEDELFVLVIRDQTGVLEARCSADRARSMKDWISALSQALGRGTATLGISAAEADQLRVELNAHLDQFTGKETGGGIYDTRSMSRSPACNDLAVEQQFIQDTATLAAMNQNIGYTSATDGTEVSLKVGLRTGSVYFRTTASEAIVDEVFGAVRQVKGF